MTFTKRIKSVALIVFSINRKRRTANAFRVSWRSLTATQDNVQYPCEDNVTYNEKPIFLVAQVVAVHHLRCK